MLLNCILYQQVVAVALQEFIYFKYRVGGDDKGSWIRRELPVFSSLVGASPRVSILNLLFDLRRARAELGIIGNVNIKVLEEVAVKPRASDIHNHG